MVRIAIACALLVGCGDELAATELPSCGQLRDGHWDSRFIIPGASGLSPNVVAIQRMPDGAIIAAGQFDGMSGIRARNIARWDGTRWSALGSGLPGRVASVAVDDRGELWAVGEVFGIGKPIDGPGGKGAGSYLARWTGTQWTFVVQNAFNIYGVTAVDGGIAIFGSFFQQSNLPGSGVPASGIAILRDGEWSSTGLASGDIRAAYRNGSGVCASGVIQQTFEVSVHAVSCWNGSTWSLLGDALPNVNALVRAKDGRWYAGGFLTLPEDQSERYGIARLEDDGRWHSLDGGVYPRDGVGAVEPAEVTSISVDDDGLVIGGRFDWVGAPRMRAYNLARWSPTTGWSAMTAPTDLFGRLSVVLSAGERTYVGGAFARIGVQPGAAIAAVDGGDAHSIPEAALTSTRLGAISDMVALPDGILVAGRFKDPEDLGVPEAELYSLLRFDGDWERAIEGVPIDTSMATVALPGGYAVRAGTQLYRRFDDQQWQLVTDRPVTGPLVADGDGRLFFIVDTQPSATIVQTTRDDTSFYAVVPGRVVTMAIHAGELVVVTSNELLGGQMVYRRHDDEWQLIGSWSDFTNSLVSSPALGLVAATQSNTRVWNGAAWRTISNAATYDMAACADGVVAAIDEGDGSRLAFLDDPDGEWTYFGEPRNAQWWQIIPTERGIYVSASVVGESGASVDSPLSFARWTTLDDTGW